VKPTLCLIPALALALAACAPQTTDQPTSAGTGTAPAEATVGTPAPNGTAAAQLPTATVNPTSMAIAQNFQVPIRGSSEAKVRIYEFSDFLCPYCGRFARETAKEISKKYGPDEVAFVYWDFPLSSHGIMSLVAAEAGHCAEEQQKGGYVAMHDALFGNQEKLDKVDPNDEAGAIKAAIEIAKGVGVNEAAMKECLDSKRYRQIVGALQSQALDRGVEMTPTFVLVSRSLAKNAKGEYDYGDPETALGALPMADMDAFIQRSLSRSMGTQVPTPTPAPTETAAPETPAPATTAAATGTP
jgi:protein-disulfide isomerase